MEDKDKKELTHLQTVLKAFKTSGYAGNTEGNPDPSINNAITKTIEHIKKKLPDDPKAQNLSLSVSDDGKISGSVGSLSSLITKASNIDMYKLFEKSPFFSGKIESEEDLKKAIEATKSGLSSTFSSASQHQNILKEFESAVKSKSLSDLQQGFDEVNKFKKTVPGSAEKTATQLAEKNASLIKRIVKLGSF